MNNFSFISICLLTLLQVNYPLEFYKYLKHVSKYVCDNKSSRFNDAEINSFISIDS